MVEGLRGRECEEKHMGIVVAEVQVLKLQVICSENLPQQAYAAKNVRPDCPGA